VAASDAGADGNDSLFLVPTSVSELLKEGVMKVLKRGSVLLKKKLSDI
jgi:hypothetical protein